MGQDTIPDHNQQDGRPGASGRGIRILPSRDEHVSAQEETDPPEQTAHALPRPGEAIGQYEIIRELGRGGMGAVYLARDKKLGRRVAVKFLQTTSPKLADRFILEARATARCHHDNIIDIYEVGEHRGNPYMVLEYLQGSPLDRLVGEGRRLAPGRIIELIVPVVRALVCAHQHGIVHRDLKPENIFVTESGAVKVLDFGIAEVVQDERAVPELLAAMEQGERSMPHLLAGLGENVDGDAPRALTNQHALMGTVPYMSPEQVSAAAGQGTIDHRTDIWALGIMLHEMLSGEHPLEHLRGMALAFSVMFDGPLPRLRSKYPFVPDELSMIALSRTRNSASGRRASSSSDSSRSCPAA